MEINKKLNWGEITTRIEENGWKHKDIGTYKSGSDIKEIKGFKLFVRERDFDDFLKMSSFSNLENPIKSRVSGWGSKTTMGNQKDCLTPCVNKSLPALSDFENYPSMMAARPDKPCILIGYDSEWNNLEDGGRELLSWQFAVVHDYKLIEFVFIIDGTKRLSLDLALGYILDYLNVPSIDVRKIRRYAYCSGWSTENKPQITITDNVDEARKSCVHVYKGLNAGEVDGWTHQLISEMPDKSKPRSARDWAYFHTFLDYKAVKPIDVTILCHFGIADLTSVTYDDYFVKRLTSVQGGLVTMQPIITAPKSLKNVNNTSVFPISLNISDTMCHAPVGKKKLEDLGKAVGIHKIDIPKERKAHMLDLLINDPKTFIEYASTDSVVTLMYASALYGYNNTPAITITSATSQVMKGSIMNYMNVTNSKDFDEKYRGLKVVSHGKVAKENNLGFLEASSLEPISDKVHTVQYYCTQAFRGGYNGCSEVGHFPQLTFDYDMQNAYPTAMCLVPDPDYDNPIKMQVQNRKMDIRDFMSGNIFNPLIPFVGYCRFKFPKNVKYACIPINVDGVPCYPYTSDGLDGVYVAGPFVYLALRLGAEVFCENGYFINTKLTDDFKESRSLSFAVKQLVQDRKKAKNDHGKGCLEELILKMMVCSGYGKVGQNVIDKHTWSAFKDEMENIGCSAITDPFRAMMITSIVQCTLLAAQNQINDLDYMSCSNTTDGFISNCPFDTLKDLDLYGFKPFLEQSRLFLTDGKDPSIWEIKHCQDDLINITTRGNVSLHFIEETDKNGNVIKGNPMILNEKAYPGVCAHNSAKSGFVSDSYEDRLWFMTQVLSRTGPIECENESFSNLKDYIQSHGSKDFGAVKRTRKLHMDFDMKRKPIRSSFRTDYPVINGVTYEIAHFDTEPFENVEEFRLYRKKKELCNCLRTQADWDDFFLKVDTKDFNKKIKDLDWSILMSIIMGYRANKWDIPALNGLTVEEKCDWINQHNDSKRKFKPSDWKNARRPERQVNMLPYEMIKDKLNDFIYAV